MTAAVFELSQSVLKSNKFHRSNSYMPDWASWSIREAAEKTGYHPEYLRWLIGQGKIEAEKVGNMWLVKVESLKSYIKDAKETGDARFGPQGEK